MYCWFFLWSILYISSSCAESERYKFLPDKYVLKRCIADYFTEVSNLNIGKAVEDISEIVAEKFYGRILQKRQFHTSVTYYFRTLIKVKSYLFADKKIPRELKTALKGALKNCVERYRIPKFENEPRVLAEFLDFGLVNWPTSLKEMISTREGRSTLRLYAYSAGVRLMSALRYFSMNQNIFHRELRRVWMLRAQQFYDGIEEIPYIRHRFTTNRDRTYLSRALEEIHTVDDVNSFVSRGSETFSYRNPVVSRRYLEPGPSQQVDSQFVVTSAENYLGSHLNQCYRIIFYVLEMQLRGIVTDFDDIYSGHIPISVIPIPIREMVWNSAVYMGYLKSLRKRLKPVCIEECLSCSTKEDLIVLLTLTILKKSVSSTTTTSTTTTVKTITSADSPDNKELSQVDTRYCGKYLIPDKTSKSMFSKHNQQQLGQPDHNNNNRYGFVVFSDDHDQFTIVKEDQPEFIKILREVNLIHQGISLIVNSSSYPSC